MKKCYLLIFTLFLLSSCGHTRGDAIEQYCWQLSTAQNERGSVVACGIGRGADFGCSVELDLVCTAEGGVLTVENRTSGQFCSGTYTLQDSHGSGVIYTITLDQEQGYATVSDTKYNDSTAVPTLILCVDGCTAQFFPVDPPPSS